MSSTYAAASTLQRGFAGKGAGGAGNWKAFDLCFHHQYDSGPRVCDQDNGRFYPTEIGTVVCDLLVKNFPYIFDIAYTAKLERNSTISKREMRSGPT